MNLRKAWARVRTLSQKGRREEERKMERGKGEKKEEEGRGQERRRRDRRREEGRGEGRKRGEIKGPRCWVLQYIDTLHWALQLAALVSGTDSSQMMRWLLHLQSKADKPPATQSHSDCLWEHRGESTHAQGPKGSQREGETRHKAEMQIKQLRVAFKGTLTPILATKCNVWPIARLRYFFDSIKKMNKWLY